MHSNNAAKRMICSYGLEYGFRIENSSLLSTPHLPT